MEIVWNQKDVKAGRRVRQRYGSLERIIVQFETPREDTTHKWFVIDITTGKVSIAGATQEDLALSLTHHAYVPMEIGNGILD